MNNLETITGDFKVNSHSNILLTAKSIKKYIRIKFYGRSRMKMQIQGEIRSNRRFLMVKKSLLNTCHAISSPLETFKRAMLQFYNIKFSMCQKLHSFAITI